MASQDSMRRRGSTEPLQQQLQANGHSETHHEHVVVRRRHRKPRLRGKDRMDASRRFIVWLLLGSVVVGLLFVVSLTSSKPGQRLGSNAHRNNLTPPRDFTRFTVNAPECSDLDPEDVTYTLVTQLSEDRIWMMEHHCDRWGSISPISVAVFTNQSEAEIREKLEELGCSPDTLSVQVIHSDLYSAGDYPVNVLRNKALSMVTTTHVMYSDVDFWESENLHDYLQQADVKQTLALDPKRLLVVPAFQLNRQCREWKECPEKNIPKMPRNKVQLVEQVKAKQVFPFDPTNRGGHGSTLYATWFKQHAADVIDIPCIRSNRYEPYMVFRYCHDLPPFHEEFSGYGKNKMTTVMHMRRVGYQFSQLGGGFVIHYPHLDSKSRMEWNEGPKELLPQKDAKGKWHQEKPKNVRGVDWTAYKRGQVDKTFDEFRQWLNQQIPDESKVPACDDFADDDAKLWINRDDTE